MDLLSTIDELVADETISNPDGTETKAIAVTEVNNSNGTWQYKIGEGDWTEFSNPSESEALLLDSTDSIRFVPNADYNGSADISFRLWDKSTGEVGTTADTTTNGGTTAFSSQTATADITIAPINDAAPEFITFIETTGTNNPLDSVDVGLESTPTFADLDGDSDLDAFVGNHDGSIAYYRNTGDASNSSLIEVTSTDNPFNGVNVGAHSSPTFADLDGDGDLDAVIGNENGNIKYYKNVENTGEASNLSLIEVTGTDNPFDSVDVGSYSSPTFADLDDDGDLDAVIGKLEGGIDYYQNTGDSSNPSFSLVTGTDNPFDSVDVGSYSSPTFADLDGDGDLDAFVGNFDGTINYFENRSSTYSFTAIDEDAADPDGSAVAELITDGTIADADGEATEAIAVTEVDNSNGTWQYKIGEGDWTEFSNPSESEARLLDSENSIRFVPNANYNGSADISFRLWDKSTGEVGTTADTTANGGTTAFSSQTATAEVPEVPEIPETPEDPETPETPVIDLEDVKDAKVFRFFNQAKGSHFYTADEFEKDFIVENFEDYVLEGCSYESVDADEVDNAADVFRFFNSTTGNHFYTSSEVEKDFIIENLADMSLEGTAFAAFETQVEGSIPVYRFLEVNRGVHLYTADEVENAFVEDNLPNYRSEGIAYYVIPCDDTMM